MNRHYPGDGMVTVDEIRAVACELPRTNEGLVRGQVKFRVGRIVYLAISRDGKTWSRAADLETDLSEATDVSTQHPAIVQRLSREARRIYTETVQGDQ